jgi:hypothetical protein
MSQERTERNDKTEAPLLEPQRTFIDSDLAPPIETFTEYLGCVQTEKDLKERWSYGKLSPHDANELKYLQTRINQYKSMNHYGDKTEYNQNTKQKTRLEKFLVLIVLLILIFLLAYLTYEVHK